jgi:hypothetical protein
MTQMARNAVDNETGYLLHHDENRLTWGVSSTKLKLISRQRIHPYSHPLGRLRLKVEPPKIN